jgi:phenylacetic acid degradation operon negative regulatory protein
VAALFGINENRARVALSRMAARGEVVAHGGDYTLTGRLLERSARLAVARTAATDPDDGTWHLVVVVATGDGPPARRERRDALRRARLGELRDGCWARPANLPLDLDDSTRTSARIVRGVPEADPRELAAATFDLDGWARRAATLASALDVVDLDGTDGLAEGFELDAEVLRHLQRDPLVPAALWPAGWPGPALRARFDAFDREYRARLAAAHRASAAVADQPA